MIATIPTTSPATATATRTYFIFSFSSDCDARLLSNISFKIFDFFSISFYFFYFFYFFLRCFHWTIERCEYPTDPPTDHFRFVKKCWMKTKMERTKCDAMRCDGIGWDGIRWDGMRQDETRRETSTTRVSPSVVDDNLYQWIDAHPFPVYRKRWRTDAPSVVNFSSFHFFLCSCCCCCCYCCCFCCRTFSSLVLPQSPGSLSFPCTFFGFSCWLSKS